MTPQAWFVVLLALLVLASAIYDRKVGFDQDPGGGSGR